MPKKMPTRIAHEMLTGCVLVPSLMWIQDLPPATRIRRRALETPWAFRLRQRQHVVAARNKPPLRFSVVQEADGMWRGLPFTGPVEDHKHGDIIEHKSFEAMRVAVESRYPKGHWVGTCQMIWPTSWGSMAVLYTGRWIALALLHNEPFRMPFRFIPPHAHIDIGAFSTIEQAIMAAINFTPPVAWQNCSCAEPVKVLKKPKRCPRWNGKGTHNRNCPLCQGSGVAEAQ